MFGESNFRTANSKPEDLFLYHLNSIPQIVGREDPHTFGTYANHSGGAAVEMGESLLSSTSLSPWNSAPSTRSPMMVTAIWDDDPFDQLVEVESSSRGIL